jgi:hypothetical protein
MLFGRSYGGLRRLPARGAGPLDQVGCQFGNGEAVALGGGQQAQGMGG